jgi:class 3 adenylate cyclase
VDPIVIVVLVGAAVLVVGGGGIVAVSRTRRRRARRKAARRRAAGKAQGVAGFVQDAVRVGTQVHALAKELAPQVRESLQPLAAWAKSNRPSIKSHVADDGTVTLLFSDIESSTAINERIGDEAWMDEVRGHTKLVQGLVERHRGKVVKSQGDGFMIVFRAAAHGLSFAVDLQRALDEAPTGDEPLRVRVGIHRGEAISEDGDFFGSTVAYAARVASQASGGEILVSSAVVEAAGDGFTFSPPRSVELKGISGTQLVFGVDWADAATPG